MMRNTIKSILAKYGRPDSEPRIADWRLVELETNRQERYFVGSDVEQRRSVLERRFLLTVYVDSESDKGRFRGEASSTLHTSLTEAEADEKVRLAAFAASKSRNPWFGLPEPAAAKAAIPASGFDGMDEAARMEAPRAALYAREAASGARVNSLELFVSREQKTFENSRGQSFSSGIWKGYSEFVVEAPTPEGPVELFDDIEFSEPDAERLSDAVGSRLDQVRGRSVAVPLPAIKDIPVIFTGKEAEMFFSWFFTGASTDMIFTKASSFALGMNVQKTSESSPVADPLDLWAEPVIPGLAASAIFDSDGFPLERIHVLEGGVLKTLIGSVRHADWLGVPRKGNFSLFSVSPGSMSLQDMRKGPYLEPVMFSDFRLDPITGDFGAEIRLAYYFDGTRRIPVTGGSVSGSVSELRSSMRRSSERRLASRSLCPFAIWAQGVSIASA